MDERQKKAFDFVSDYTKQLIALATGIITFSVTFLQDELSHAGIISKCLLAFSWFLFILSVCFGIMRLMALTANLDPVDPSNQPNLTIASNNVRRPGLIQIGLFVAALFLSIIFGGIQLFHVKKKEDKDKKIIIILQHPVAGSVKGVTTDTLYPVKPHCR